LCPEDNHWSDACAVNMCWAFGWEKWAGITFLKAIVLRQLWVKWSQTAAILVHWQSMIFKHFKYLKWALMGRKRNKMQRSCIWTECHNILSLHITDSSWTSHDLALWFHPVNGSPASLPSTISLTTP
jgi:hypothetical protein